MPKTFVDSEKLAQTIFRAIPSELSNHLMICLKFTRLADMAYRCGHALKVDLANCAQEYPRAMDVFCSGLGCSAEELQARLESGKVSGHDVVDCIKKWKWV